MSAVECKTLCTPGQHVLLKLLAKLLVGEMIKKGTKTRKISPHIFKVNLISQICYTNTTYSKTEMTVLSGSMVQE